MTTSQLTDNELALDFQQSGTPTAYDRLYMKYFPILTMKANVIVRDFGIAQDLAQESLIKIYRALVEKTYQAKSQFIAWADCILRNTIIDYLRSIKKGGKKVRIWANGIMNNDVPDRELNPEGSTHYMLLQEWFKECCLQMGTSRGKILYLAAVHRFSMEEIAIEMGNSKGSVKSELSKARARMRKQVPYYKNLAY